MAMSVMQGRPAPRFLAPSIVHYPCHGDETIRPSVAELPSAQERSIWQEVVVISSEVTSYM